MPRLLAGAAGFRLQVIAGRNVYPLRTVVLPIQGVTTALKAVYGPILADGARSREADVP